MEHDSDQRRVAVSRHSAHSGTLLAAPTGAGLELADRQSPTPRRHADVLQESGRKRPFFHYYELSFRSSGSTLIVEEEEDQAEVGQRGDPRSVLELHV